MITVLAIDELEEGTSKGIEINNRYLFAIKKEGAIYLYWNRCPHLGTPLEWEEDRFLDADGALIQCSTHGALFQISDGKCLVGPCQGKHLKPVPFTIAQNLVMVADELLQAPKPS